MTAAAVAALLALWAMAAALAAPAATPKAGGGKPPAAASSAQEAKAAPAEADDKDRVVFENADRLFYHGDRKLYVLEGNVRMKHKDMTLTCDYAEYYEETDKAEAKGHILMRDPETEVTGDVIKVDFTDEMAVVDGNVVIVAQKKKKGAEAGATAAPEAKAGAQPPAPKAEGQPSGTRASPDVKAAAKAQPSAEDEEKAPRSIEEARQRRTTVHCTRVRYRYTDGDRYAWITGPIHAEQKKRQAWADQAEFDDEDGTLKLVGNVRVKTDQGDEFSCPAALVSVDEEWLRAEGISGMAVRKKKKAGEQPAQATEAGAGGAPPAAPPPAPPGPAPGGGQNQ